MPITLDRCFNPLTSTIKNTLCRSSQLSDRKCTVKCLDESISRQAVEHHAIPVEGSSRLGLLVAVRGRDGAAVDQLPVVVSDHTNAELVEDIQADLSTHGRRDGANVEVDPLAPGLVLDGTSTKLNHRAPQAGQWPGRKRTRGDTPGMQRPGEPGQNPHQGESETEDTSHLCSSGPTPRDTAWRVAPWWRTKDRPSR